MFDLTKTQNAVATLATEKATAKAAAQATAKAEKAARVAPAVVAGDEFYNAAVANGANGAAVCEFLGAVASGARLAHSVATKDAKVRGAENGATEKQLTALATARAKLAAARGGLVIAPAPTLTVQA